MCLILPLRRGSLRRIGSSLPGLLHLTLPAWLAVLRTWRVGALLARILRSVFTAWRLIAHMSAPLQSWDYSTRETEPSTCEAYVNGMRKPA